MAEESAGKVPIEQAPAAELHEGRWSVVSFDRVEAGALTYAEAFAKLEELDRAGVTGLCIITDEAASRLNTGS